MVPSIEYPSKYTVIEDAVVSNVSQFEIDCDNLMATTRNHVARNVSLSVSS